MDLEMVLNELSIRTPASDIPTARQWMSELIQTLRQATSRGVKRVLRTSHEINSLELAPNYPIARWRNDNQVDREEKRFFITLTTKAPFWTDFAEGIKNQFDLSEVWYQGESAQGLGFVLIIDGLAISFPSNLQWNFHLLEVQVRRLDEDGNLIDVVEEVKHASHKTHIQQHTEWIKTRIRITVIDGSELWRLKEELFPNLEFCDDVYEQLTNLNSQHPMLQIIKNRLFKLEEYCKNWSEGGFNSETLGNCSTESQVTLQNPKYKTERTFRCPDGEERLFSWHLKLSQGWRIYFFPQEPGKIIIGYIDKHLPTSKYPN
jgi:hypothetical protein